LPCRPPGVMVRRASASLTLYPAPPVKRGVESINMRV